MERPRRWPMREIVDAIFYVLRSGCPWHMVPDCFPPASTVYRWFMRLREEGVFATMNHHLMMRDRERTGRECHRATDPGLRRDERQAGVPATRPFGLPPDPSRCRRGNAGRGGTPALIFFFSSSRCGCPGGRPRWSATARGLTS
ncbi:Mobile element protein [Lutibaculum baratangense AMV1]|uniref:Mobile element protein n=1 Tax=Lutibaculum baratangense AMV1 TaxID=631454 RepID=V4RFB9_9HYPH|nr:Mobile element protein [Lutibaculum baratangense AMV1]